MTKIYVTTRAQKQKALLDLSKDRPSYLNADREDNECLHPLSPTAELSALPHTLSVELAREVLEAFREAYPRDEEFGEVHWQTASDPRKGGAYQLDA